MPQFPGFSRVRRRAAHSAPSSHRSSSRPPRSVVTSSAHAAAPKRFAFAQPRALMGAMVVLMGAGVWWAAAQNGGSSTQSSGSSSAAPRRHVSLEDLPGMVVEYGARKARALRQKASTSSGISAKDGFSLEEIDLTPHTPSDEREPAYSPSGAQIAFASNGAIVNGKLAALNTEKRYHIFIIDRGGGNLRQLTGLGTDKNRDQRHPAWAPDGQQLVYTDTPIVIPASTSSTQLFVVRPFTDTNNTQTGIQVGTPEQRTFSAGRKISPTWSASGLSIAFAADYDLTLNSPTALGQLDIFTIAPTGEPSSVQRLTGGTNDPLGNTTDDTNPCYATAQVNLVYFSSNRAADTAGNIIKLNNIGRRIWFVNDTTLTLQQVTNSRLRPGGRDADRDDYPSVSNGLDVGGASTADRIAFQTDTYIDTADVNSGSKSKDFNIWTLTVNSAQFVPTPTATPQPSPVFVVSGSTSSTVGEYNAQTGAFRRTLISPVSTSNPNGAANPSGIAFYDIDGDGTEDVLVANRNGGTNGAGSVDAYNPTTGAFIRRVVTGSYNVGNRLSNPSFLKVVGNQLFVGSGAKDPTFNSTNPPAGTQGSGNGVYRFTLSTTGAATNNPGVGAPAGSARFTNGEASAAQITDGVEGFDFDQQGNLYVASVNDNFVNEYSAAGTWITTFITAGSGGLAKPTGVRFTLDNQYLLVASNATDDIKRYDASSGAYVDDLVSDADGTARSLNSPYGIDFNDSNQDGTKELFTTSARVNGDNALLDPVNNPGGVGTNVLRFDSFDANTPVGTNPFASNVAVRGVTYFAFNQSARNLTIVTTPTPTPVPQAIESSRGASAELESNLTSAPDRVPAFDGGVEDRLEDIEPAVSKSTINNTAVGQITFVSLRTAAAIPGVANTSGGNAAPTVQNEYGGATGTHDLWTTGTRDTTPPILVPQAAGNQIQFPLLAPGPQAQQVGLTAPRTPEDRQLAGNKGLGTNGQLVTAFVLAEPESGLTSVSITVRNAEDDSRFIPQTTRGTNENLLTQTTFETKPDPVAGYEALPIAFYDDGPPTRKSRKTGQLGHERQPNAVEGDGIYYCESRNSRNTTAPQILTPGVQGDYFIDINVNDAAGNEFTYDNIWGFSTRPFPSTTNATNDLFVSDYTAGQDFVAELSSNFDGVSDVTGRYALLYPVESYYLTNPSGVASNPDNADEGIATADPTTFPNVDVYRTQCRGPLTAAQLAAYTPGTVFQLDPNEKTNGTPGPFLDKTRRFADAKRVILWGAPYAGTAFVGPGSIDDPDSQRILTDYLNAGGRMFLDGEDVIYALSNAGQTDNAFLRNELQASFDGETGFLGDAVDLLNGQEGRFTFYPYGPPFDFLPYPADYNNPQLFPRVPKFGPYNDEQRQNNYSDAAPGGFRVDIMGAGSGGSDTTTTPAYTIARAAVQGNALVGQRVQRTRTSSVQSRVVFFSFNFTAVNRRYGVVTINNVPRVVAANIRRIMGDTMREYMKTGGISGQVINAKTNLPIPDFLVVIRDSQNNVYLARTDSTGTYELDGLPATLTGVLDSTYTASPAPYGVQNLANQNLGFFYNPQFVDGPIIVPPGGVNSANNFRIQPISPGTIAGRIVDQSGANIPNLPVLIKTVDENSVFPGGGPFIQIARTDAGGNFAFTNVPASVTGQNVPLLVILNPDVADIPTSQDALITSYQQSGGPRQEYARRQLPDDDRPTVIQAVSGNTYYLNESDPDTQADDSKPLILPARLRKITGIVAAQTVPGTTTVAVGAKVELVSQTDNKVKQTTTTDSSGRYNFANVAFDNYRVRASLDLNTPRVPKTPGLPTVGLSPAFRVAVGPLAPITVSGILLQARDLRGQVTYNGTAQNGATVQLLVGTTVVDTVKTVAVNGTDGIYTFLNIPAGTYSVRASFTTGGTTSTVTSASFTTTITTNSAEVLAGPNIAIFQRTISGTVSRRTTTSSGSATVAPASGATVTLRLQGSNTVLQTVTTGSTGAYSFANLANGTYIVTATLPSGATASETVTVSNTNTAIIKNFVITEGAVSGIVKRQLTTRSGTSTAGAAGATVTATGNGFSLATTTASDGSYNFSGLVPGTYTLIATLPNSGATSAPATVTVSTTQSASQDFTIVEGSLFGSVTYKVGTTTSAASGAVVTVTQNGTQVRSPVTITSTGLFDLNNFKPGTYTVTATYLGQTKSATVTITAAGASPAVNLLFTLQGVYGRVTFNGTPQVGARVLLINSSGAGVGSQVSNSQGYFLFSPVVNGTYTVQATLGIRRGTKTAVVPANGQVLNIGNVELSDSSSSTAGPYTAGSTYLITVPYTDSADALSTTQVYKAFSALPVGADGAENYQLFRYDPLATPTNGAYVKLNANSTIMRGQGLLLKVLRNSVAILDSSVDSSRKSMTSSVTSFAITLHRASSNSTDLGQNLIGSPFVGRTINYLRSQVIYNGRTLTLQQAVSEQLISPNLTTYVTGSTTTQQSTTLEPEVGYFVNAYQDGIQLVLTVN